MPDIDYLIVGQGLAGSFLGYSLIKRNKKILLFDADEANTSSKVAAGIFNPVTGQRMALSWNAHKLFPFLDAYYKNLELEFYDKFYFPSGIYKPFLQIKDQNDWMGRSVDSNFMPFIKKISNESRYGNLINDFYGGIELSHSGFVNTNILLSAFTRFFRKKNALVQHGFDQNLLNLFEDHITYGDIVAKKIIFCEGAAVTKNRFFGNWPFAPVKGELLTVKLAVQPEQIISKDIFVLPIGGSMVRVGSTYDRINLENKITEEARIFLEEKMKLLLKIDYEVVNQQVGIRPGTKDRRPFIGLHPELKPIGLFNGLGTKGISIGPYYSDQFADFLVFNKKIDNDANLLRYR
jgi:glycine oxidase